MTSPILNLIFIQGFNLDLELLSHNACFIILCEMIIRLVSCLEEKSPERNYRKLEDFRPCVQILVLMITGELCLC